MSVIWCLISIYLIGYHIIKLRYDFNEKLNTPIPGRETPQEIKDAMMKMGPNYFYMTEGKKLLCE